MTSEVIIIDNSDDSKIVTVEENPSLVQVIVQDQNEVVEAAVVKSELIEIVSAGPQGPPGSGFLPSPDMLDDTIGFYFYFGWESINGGWLIRRTDKSTAKQDSATIDDNPAHDSISAAWANRHSLTYV